MMLSLGSYIEQEATKKDSWRDSPYGELYAHLKHEIDELKRSKGKTVQLHNAIDCCTLSALIICKILGEDK